MEWEEAPLYVAWILTESGDTDGGFEWLERAYELRDPLLPMIRSHPELSLSFDRTDPRYLNLMRRLDLP
jgi:hypothetical protein